MRLYPTGLVAPQAIFNRSHSFKSLRLKRPE